MRRDVGGDGTDGGCSRSFSQSGAVMPRGEEEGGGGWHCGGLHPWHCFMASQIYTLNVRPSPEPS